MTAKKATKKKAPAKKKMKKAQAVGTATLSAILGRPMSSPASKRANHAPPSTNTKVKPEWAKYQKRLLSLREQLVSQMGGLAKESAELMDNYSLHMADSGTDNFDRDFALSLLSSDQDAIYEIDEALKRIEKNTFGTCELTGKPIPKARLDAIPWARFTVEAQRQLEREGAMRQRKLGSLGTLEGNGGVEIEEDEEDHRQSSKDRD